MTNMTEEEIYELLQEITGIKQYEIKKEESLKYLAETAKEKEKIKEILDEIHLKIENISNEKDTYENYEKKENKTKWYYYDYYYYFSYFVKLLPKNIFFNFKKAFNFASINATPRIWRKKSRKSQMTLNAEPRN